MFNSDDLSVASGDLTPTVDADGGMVVPDAGCTDGDVLVAFPPWQDHLAVIPLAARRRPSAHDGGRQLDSR